MTDAEIKKVLECCTDNDINSCEKCPIKIECYTETIDCKKEALDLINRQQAMIERLQNECFCIANERDAIADCLDTAVEEAIKEFAERLKGKFNDDADVLYEQPLVHYQIDNLVKEMVGDAE